MMSQKEAVYSATLAILKEGNVFFMEGETNVKDVINSTIKKQIDAILFVGFKKGEIQLSTQFNDIELAKYVSGLSSNWFRKDTRLNGGGEYSPSYTRGPVGDPVIKELKKLLTMVKGTDKEAKVQAAIEKRSAEVKPTVEINAELIPAHLRDLLG